MQDFTFSCCVCNSSLEKGAARFFFRILFQAFYCFVHASDHVHQPPTRSVADSIEDSLDKSPQIV